MTFDFTPGGDVCFNKIFWSSSQAIITITTKTHSILVALTEVNIVNLIVLTLNLLLNLKKFFLFLVQYLFHVIF